MEIANCPKCGKIFQKYSDPICESCMKKEEELFQSVRKYLVDNPDCRLDEVSKETGVSVKKIMRYLKEGRLEVSKGLEGSLHCEQCDKPIASGRYCDKCIIELSHAVDDMFGNVARAKEKSSKGVKMHTKMPHDK